MSYLPTSSTSLVCTSAWQTVHLVAKIRHLPTRADHVLGKCPFQGPFGQWSEQEDWANYHRTRRPQPDCRRVTLRESVLQPQFSDWCGHCGRVRPIVIGPNSKDSLFRVLLAMVRPVLQAGRLIQVSPESGETCSFVCFPPLLSDVNRTVVLRDLTSQLRALARASSSNARKMAVSAPSAVRMASNTCWSVLDIYVSM